MWVKKWSAAYDRHYFVNVSTSVSTWDAPSSSDTIVGELEGGEGDLQYFKKWSSKKQHFYYINATTGESVWVLPEKASIITPP